MAKRKQYGASLARGKTDRRPGVSLARFAKAKTSTYDKRAQDVKRKALQARKINDYRRLKARLEKEGRLQPLLRLDAEEDEEELKAPNNDLQRALRRAGPALGDDSSESDAVGNASPPRAPQRLNDNEAGGLREADLRGGKMDLPVFPDSRKGQGAGLEDTQRQQAAEGTSRKNEVKNLRKKRPKPPSQVQILAAKVQAKKDEKQAGREKAHLELEERQKRIAEKEKQRQKEREAFFKKNKRGQPVMKHRVDKMLSKLQAELL